MSDNVTPQFTNEQIAAQTQARDVLLSTVFIPSFFNKLAQFNITPQSEADAREMLRIADLLAAAEANGITKSASVQEEQPDGFLKTAGDSLESMLRKSAPVSIPQEAHAAARVISSAVRA